MCAQPSLPQHAVRVYGDLYSPDVHYDFTLKLPEAIHEGVCKQLAWPRQQRLTLAFIRADPAAHSFFA